jgi:hypothetical protein
MRMTFTTEAQRTQSLSRSQRSRTLTLCALKILCVLCASVVNLTTAAYAKPPAGIEIGVECGYDGYVQQGRLNPVTVTLRNSSQNLNISGELVLAYDGVEYSAPLELPTPSEKRFFLYFPAGDYAPQLTLRVRSKQYTDQFSLFDPASFKSMEPDDLSVLVLSRQQGVLNMLNQKTLAHLHRNPYRSAQSQLSSGQVFVSYYKPEEVDPNAKFFERADVIVLGDIDYQQVTPELAEALSAAVSGGAGLVFSMGFNGAGIASSPLAPLCPLAYTGTVQAKSLGQFGSRYGIQPQGAPAVLAVGQLTAGAEVLDYAGKVPVVVQAQRGSGTVTALAFDVDEAPFKRNNKVSSIFMENVLQVADTASVDSSFMHPYPVQLLLGKLSEAKPMTPGFVLLYLLAYVLLIGPFNFLILDRFKRRTLVWTTIPALIIAFSWLGLQTGFIRRGANNIAAYVQELHVYPGAAYAPYQTVMLLFTARRTDYTLELQDESSYLHASVPQPQDLFGMSNSALTIASRGKLLTAGKPLLKASQGQWDQRSYSYNGHLALGGKTSSQLRAVPGKEGLSELTGSFTLDLPVDLKYCKLIGPGYERDAGDLSGHGVYDIAKLQGGNQPAPAGNYLLAQRDALLDEVQASSLFTQFYRDEVLLVGFSEEVDTLPKLSARSRDYKLGMVVVHLPFTAVLETNGAPEVRTLLTGGSAFELRDGNYGGYPGSRGHVGNPSTARSYSLLPGSYLDLTCTVSGRLDPSSEVLLHLRGWDSKNQPVSDWRIYVQVEHLVGNKWTRAKMTEPAQLDLPLGSGRRIPVRIRCVSECVLELPDAEVH